MSALPISMNRPPSGSSSSDASTNSPRERVQALRPRPCPRSRRRMLLELERARGGDLRVIHAQRPSTAHFAGLAVANTSAPRCRRELHRCHSHPAGRRMHQQPLARLQAREVHQRRSTPSGTPSGRRRLGKTTLGHTHEQATIGDRDRPERTGSSPITRSPTARPSTSGPTSSTTPAPSPPRVASPGYIPNAIRTSRKFRPPHACRSEPGQPRAAPGASGAGTSEILKASPSTNIQPPLRNTNRRHQHTTSSRSVKPRNG